MSSSNALTAEPADESAASQEDQGAALASPAASTSPRPRESSRPVQEGPPRHGVTKTQAAADTSASALAAVTLPAGIGIGTLHRYLEVPFMHKRMIASVLLASLLLGWLAILVWPRMYESEAKLKIRVGRESVALDPTVTTSETMLMQKTREEEIVSTLDVLGSRRVLEEVVNRVGAEAILDGELPDNGVAQAKGWFSRTAEKAIGAGRDCVDWGLRVTGIRSDVPDQELAVKKLQEDLAIFASKKSSVVSVNGQAKSPQMAQRLVQEMVDVFLVEHMKSSATPGSLAFFMAEQEKTQQMVDEMIEERGRFLREHNLVSIEANRTMLQEKLVNVNRELISLQSTKEKTTAEIEELQTQIGAMDEEVVASKLSNTSAAWTGVRQKVADLELEEQRLASRFTDTNPRLASVRQQLRGAREIMKRIQTEEVNPNTTLNPSKQAARQDLRRAETTLVGIDSAYQEKLRQREELEQESRALLENEQKLIAMERDIAVMEDALSNINSKLEQARLIEQLEEQRITNVSVFQPASLIERPFTPKKPLIAAMAVVLGLGCGAGLALLREASSTKVRTSGQAAHAARGTPVLAVPHARGGQHRKIRGDFASTLEPLAADLLLSAEEAADEGRPWVVGLQGDDQGRGVRTMMAALAELAAANSWQTAKALDWTERTQESPAAFVDALQDMGAEADLILVSLPHARAGWSAKACQAVDEVLLVARSEVTEVDALQRLVQRHQRAGNTKRVRVLLNDCRDYLPRIARPFIPKENAVLT